MNWFSKSPCSRLRNCKRSAALTLQFEKLEPRVVLAGNVTASLFLDHLLVLGDALDNQVQIVGTANGGASVVGLEGTTVNGGTAAFHSVVQLRSVGVRLDGGNDELLIDGVVPRMSMVLEGNAGDDRFVVNNTWVRNFLVNGGEGNDIVEVNNLRAERFSWIMTESGNDIVAVASHAAGRHLTVSTGNGNDVVALNDLQSGRSFYVDAGTGNDHVLMAGNTRIGWRSDVHLGAGNDFLGIMPRPDATFGLGTPTTLDGGIGNDNLVVDPASTIQRALVTGFENGTGFQLQQTLDELFSRLVNQDIDPVIFGGPELQREQSVMIDATDLPAGFTESDPPTPVDPGLVVTPGTRSGNNNVLSASVRFAAGYVAGQDMLEFTPVAGIIASFNQAAGVLSFTGEASAADYQTLLRSVEYLNDTFEPEFVAGTRVIEFQVSANGSTPFDSRELFVSAATDEQLIQNFLAENNLTSTRTASGLHFIVEQSGNGDFPSMTDSVVVNYRGFLLDGTEFDSGQNVTFSLTNLIEGWEEGIPMFSVGGSGQLLIPSDLAYGEQGTATIPPNSVLRFEIELLDVIHTSLPILDVCLDGHDNLAVHEHANLSIIIDGVAQQIAANIGINDAVCTGLRGIHTHDSSGTLHIETPSLMNAPLEAFFQIWGETFNSSQILGNVANANQEVVMLVNGALNSQYENYLLQEGDVIEIHYRDRTP